MCQSDPSVWNVEAVNSMDAAKVAIDAYLRDLKKEGSDLCSIQKEKIVCHVTGFSDGERVSFLCSLAVTDIKCAKVIPIF